MKRGLTELLLEGDAAPSLVAPVIELLRRGESRDQILISTPPEARSDVEELLDTLARRRLIGDSTPATGATPLQSSFWNHFGPAGEQAPQQLQQSVAVVFGANQIARSLIRSSLEMGLGRVVLVEHPTLDNEVAPFNDDDIPAPLRGRFERRAETPSEAELAACGLLCASCDFGEPDALLEIGRLALQLEKPFLPAWLVDLRGVVGPLVYPYQSACLRCFRARSDSNSPHPQAAREVRYHMTSYREARASAASVPPMTGVIGEICAMELAKSMGSFAPGDAVGRQIEINLVSFNTAARRVLKVPRCPDCSDTMRRAAPTRLAGMLLPHAEDAG